MSSQPQKITNQAQNLIKIVSIVSESLLKKRTWAEMAFDDDEQERLREEENKMKNILAARRFLYNIGQYELEEGEILE